MQVVDAAISESVFNMLEGCVPEYTEQGYNRPPSGSTISGAPARHRMRLLTWKSWIIRKLHDEQKGEKQVESGNSKVPQGRHPEWRHSIGCNLVVCVNERVLIEGSLHGQVWSRQPPSRRVMGGM